MKINIICCAAILVTGVSASAQSQEKPLTLLDGFKKNPQRCYPIGTDAANPWKKDTNQSKHPNQWYVDVSCKPYTDEMRRRDPSYNEKYFATGGAWQFEGNGLKPEHWKRIQLIQSTPTGGDYVAGTANTEGWRCRVSWEGTEGNPTAPLPSGLFCQAICCSMPMLITEGEK